MAYAPGSRARLTEYDLPRFAGRTLFDRLGRAVCQAGCLPRKELYEAWEVARRARRLFRGGRVIDVGGGHGLLAHTMLVLDDTSPSALVIDPAPPPSSEKVHAAIVAAWPRLADRIRFLPSSFEQVELLPGDLVVSCHACGALTDLVLGRGVSAKACLAVLPCCHDLATCETGGLEGWLEGPLAIDVARALKVRAAGYHVRTQTIPPSITPRNRLLLAWPAGTPSR